MSYFLHFLIVFLNSYFKSYDSAGKKNPSQYKVLYFKKQIMYICVSETNSHLRLESSAVFQYVVLQYGDIKIVS